MIISHEYQYLFVELPRTGSTAISRELRETYSGLPILDKHATYYQFLKTARPQERKYFVFSGIRNPLDDAVSIYVQYKNNHNNRWTDPVKRARNRGIGGYIDNKVYDWIQKNDVDFETYFLTFYRIPYNRWASLSHKNFNYIIRFEHLADDFAEALRRIGIEPKRPLPIANKTEGKISDFTSYYTPRSIKRAKRVFGPFMVEWGYEFPQEWGRYTAPWWSQAEFQFFNVLRYVYWRYLQFWFWPPRVPTKSRTDISSSSNKVR